MGYLHTYVLVVLRTYVDIWTRTASSFALELVCVRSSRANSSFILAMALSGAPKINQLLRDVDQKEGLGLVAVVDQVLTELESMGDAWSAQIRPCQVGVDPSNRDGQGVNAEDVHSLGADILSMGFSWNQVASAVCIEETPGTTSIRDFNKTLSSGCDILPQDVLEQVRYGSLACSHTNMFLRCLAEGVNSSHEELSEGGRLSLEKVRRRDPDFARAVHAGLEWKVLSSKCRVQYPKLLALIQRARNAPQAVARAEHEVQVMLRMHSMAAAQQRKSAVVDWAAIRRSVAHSKPPCANYLQEISIFLAICGGGIEGAFLKDLSSFHRQFVDSKKSCIRGQFLQALADLDVEVPYVKIAILKAQYSAPAHKINRYHEPTLIGLGDLTKLGKTGQHTAKDPRKCNDFVNYGMVWPKL